MTPTLMWIRAPQAQPVQGFQPAVLSPDARFTSTAIMERLDELQLTLFTVCKCAVYVQSTGMILVIFQRPPHSCILLTSMQVLCCPARSCLYSCLSYRCTVHLPPAKSVTTAGLLYLFNIHFFFPQDGILKASILQIQMPIVLSAASRAAAQWSRPTTRVFFEGQNCFIKLCRSVQQCLRVHSV